MAKEGDKCHKRNLIFIEELSLDIGELKKLRKHVNGRGKKLNRLGIILMDKKIVSVKLTR